jgi:hypothetical protein
VLILHYLGLDHIGHLLGPRSPRMREKLAEMDGVLEGLVRGRVAVAGWQWYCWKEEVQAVRMVPGRACGCGCGGGGVAVNAKIKFLTVFVGFWY